MDKIYSRSKIRIPIVKKIHFKNDNYNKNFKKKDKILKISFIFIVAILTAILVINGINPIIDKQCNVIAKSIATKVCNEQAGYVMNKYKYEDLCTISKDTNGNIALISANVVKVNEIISDIALRIQEKLNESKNGKFYIPLGSFTGSRILSGRGPDIEMKMSTVGNVDTELKSEFISSGINQTLHKVYLEVKCNVIVLSPFSSIEQNITNQILLTEAVIIGITPNTYYNLEGVNKSVATDIIE